MFRFRSPVVSGQSSLAFGFVLLFLLAATVERVHGQNMSKRYKISGIVLDETKQPFAYANIQVVQTGRGVTSDDNGRFEFVVPPGNYTLKVTSVGYKPKLENVKVSSFDVTGIRLQMDEDNGVQLKGVTITPKDNPAYRIVRNAIKNKDKNRMDRFYAYEFDSYSKLVIFFDNIRKADLKKPLFRKAAAQMLEGGIDTLNIDTTSADSIRYKLPIFISEAVSQTVFKAPNLKKEKILATRRKSVKDPEVGFLNSLLGYVDVYKNQVSILGKEFVSPIADGAFMNYDYFIKKIEKIGEKDTIYHIELFPRRKYDRVFKGVIQIDTRGWALRGVQLSMNTDPLINFVEDIRVKQGFDLVGDQWVLTSSFIEVDLVNMFGNQKGATGRSAVYMYNHKLNAPREDSYFVNATIEVDEKAEGKPKDYWKDAQRVPLESSEQMIYNVMDTLQKELIWKLYNLAAEIIMGGTKRWGKFEIGPISRVFSFNQVEGARPQLGIYTIPYFSTRLKLGTYGAYGSKDGRYKHESDVAYAISKRPKVEVGVNASFDVEQAGFRNFQIEGQGLINSALQRVPFRTLHYYERYQGRVAWDVMNGLAASVYVQTKHFKPGFEMQFRDVFAPGFDVSTNPALFSTYQTSEIGTVLRISFKEKFIQKGLDKVYLYSHYPQFYVEGAVGIKGFLGGHFNYQSLTITATNNLKLGRFGKLRFVIAAGKIWGALPYFSLRTFRGSVSYGIEPLGRVDDVTSSVVGRINRTNNAPQVPFNALFYNEFVTDEFIMAGVDWRLEGWLFNKIPLMRKLQWKEAVRFRMAWGRLSEQNRIVNFDQQELLVKAPDKTPYAEIAPGVENIFKILQVHFVWRLSFFSPKAPSDDLNNINTFPPPLNYNFGIRIGARLSL